MNDEIVIPFRFRGPPESGNGGYVAGAIAERFPLRPDAPDDAAVEVTLRAPIPLGTPMRVECSDESHLRLTLDAILIAEAAPPDCRWTFRHRRTCRQCWQPATIRRASRRAR